MLTYHWMSRPRPRFVEEARTVGHPASGGLRPRFGEEARVASMAVALSAGFVGVIHGLVHLMGEEARIALTKGPRPRFT